MLIERPQSDLPEKFSKIRNYDSVTLPESVPVLVLTKTDCEDYFAVAAGAWNTKFNFLQVMAQLEQIIATDIGTDIQADLKIQNAITDIGSIRKIGIILESAYMLFDQSHYCPPEIYNLMRLLGQLKDKINKKNKRREAALTIKNYLLDNQAFFNQELKFVPSDVEQYQQFYQQLAAEMKAYLDKDLITFEDLHRLRKRMRRMMNAFQLATIAKDDQGEIIKTFQYLHDLDYSLGTYHTQMLSRTPKKERESSVIPIDPEIKAKIIDFLMIK